MWYLEHLQKLINDNESVKCTVKIHAKKEKSPIKYAKKVSNLYQINIFHICDYEADDEEHIRLFHNIIDEAKKVSKLKPGIKYELGYSNFTFELWMICHKKLLSGALTSRGQYLSNINEIFQSRFLSLDDYKREENFKKILKEHINSLDVVRTALKNADKIRQKNIDNGEHWVEHSGYRYYRNNPDINMQELIRKIFEDCEIEV